MATYYEEYEAGLNRERHSSKRNAEGYVTEAARRVADKLQEMIAAGNDITAIGILLILAVIKDSIDYADLLIVSVVITKLVGLFILVLMIILMNTGPVARRLKRMQARIILYGVSFFIDLIPVLGFLPVSTIVVLLYWRQIKKEALLAQGRMEKLPTMVERDIEKIEQEFTH